MKYEDLLALPYQTNGRVGKDKGTDCYGYVIELCRRNGKNLKDLVYPSEKIPLSEYEHYYTKLNVIEIPEKDARFGDIVQCEWQGNLHIAFMLDYRTVTHMTYEGPRVTPLFVLKNRKFGRVL